METMAETEKERWLNGFKSYYVVWKPDTAFELHICHDKFKSYYVVWKLK